MKWYVFVKIKDYDKGYENNFFPGSEFTLCSIKKPQTTQRDMHLERTSMAAMTLGVRLPSEMAVTNPSAIAGIHLNTVKQGICDHWEPWRHYEEKGGSPSVNWKWTAFPLDQNC